jgi:hypothetical protein
MHTTPISLGPVTGLQHANFVVGVETSAFFKEEALHYGTTSAFCKGHALFFSP